MHLVTILLPLERNDGAPQPRALFEQLRDELVERFGGATLFSRAPAEGLWDDGGAVEREAVVLIEVVAERLERAWWAALRKRLEESFGQDEIMVRASAIERL